MLVQASLPFHSWVECVKITVHIYNLLPTPNLDNLSPHEKLFGEQPTYSHLRVFGCACFPNLASQAQHKLQPRSSVCVFVGYLDNYKGYWCFDPITKLSTYPNMYFLMSFNFHTTLSLSPR